MRCGWACVDVATLQCSFCKAVVAVPETAHLNSEWKMMLQKSKHENNCCWKMITSPTEFVELSTDKWDQLIQGNISSFDAREVPTLDNLKLNEEFVQLLVCLTWLLHCYHC